MPEFLITDAGERIEIPNAIVGETDHVAEMDERTGQLRSVRRPLVDQYMKASAAGRAALLKTAQAQADAKAEARAAQVAREAQARDKMIALHQQLASSAITPAQFERGLAAIVAAQDPPAVAFPPPAVSPQGEEE